MNKNFLAIFIIALLTRLISLNQSLWLDEATTARVMQQYDVWEIITKFSPGDFHPPLYYLFMKFWTNLLGYSEIVLRMPSILFSLLTGYLVYLLGKRIKDDNTGVWAAAFFLFNPLVVYYSQEARMYMQATFLLTFSIYFLIKMLQVKSEKSKVKSYNSKLKINLLLFNLFISMSFFTFYGSIFLIIPMFLYLLYKKEYRCFFISALFIIFSVLIISPLLYQQVSNARQQLQLVPNWTSVLGSANIKNLLLIPLKFSIGRISFYPKWLYWVISGAWTIFIWFFVAKGAIKNKFLALLVFGSLIFGVLLSFFTPLLQYFRFIYLLPIIALLLSFSVKTMINRLIIVLGFVIFSLIYLLIPQFHREDWKSLAKSIPAKEVYMVYPSSDPVQYYRRQLKIVDIRSLPNIRLSGKEIFVVPYSADIHGVDYQKILAEKKYKLVQQLVFRGLLLEKWKFYSSM